MFRTAGRPIFALEDRCPHKGGPLSQGIVHGTQSHLPAAQLDHRSGNGEATGADQGCARTFPAKIERARIYIDMGVAARAA